jgi:hypothetical protein
MKKLNINAILTPLNFAVPILYIVLGCLLFTNLLFDFDRSKKIIFGIVLILYGAFRFYKAYTKTRDSQ